MIIETIEDELGIEVNATTEDGVYTLFSVACIGCCSLAPVIMVNDETHGNLTPASPLRRILRGREGHKALQEGRGPPREPPVLKPSAVESDWSDEKSHRGNGHLRPLRRSPGSLRQARRAAGRTTRTTELDITGCIGMCFREPLVEMSEGTKRRDLRRGHPEIRRGDRQKHVLGGEPHRRRASGLRIEEKTARHRRSEARFPRPAEPHRAAQLRDDRPRVDRRLREAGRLRGPRARRCWR